MSGMDWTSAYGLDWLICARVARNRPPPPPMVSPPPPHGIPPQTLPVNPKTPRTTGEDRETSA